MSGRILFEGVSQKTQSTEAVKAFLSWQGESTEPLARRDSIGRRTANQKQKGRCVPHNHAHRLQLPCGSVPSWRALQAHEVPLDRQ